MKSYPLLFLLMFVSGCASMHPEPPSCEDDGQDLRNVNQETVLQGKAKEDIVVFKE